MLYHSLVYIARTSSSYIHIYSLGYRFGIVLGAKVSYYGVVLFNVYTHDFLLQFLTQINIFQRFITNVHHSGIATIYAVKTIGLALGIGIGTI